LIYIRDDGNVRYNFTAPKQILEIFRELCQGKPEPFVKLCNVFDLETNNGNDMDKYSELLKKAVAAIVSQFGKKSLSNLFAGRGGKLPDASARVKGPNDFEIVTWLIIKDGEDANIL
jgi:hypothetical protein